MLTVDDEELANEISNVWGTTPHVIRNILPEPIFRSSDLFRGLHVTAQAMSQGAFEPTGRIGINGRDAATQEIISFFPGPATQSFEQYEAQILQSFPGESFSIILDKIDVALPDIRKRVTPFLHKLFGKVGYPAREIHSCIYAGNYKSTPFGIHMDDCHVLMTAGVGKKSMAFWPRSRFEGQEDLMVPGSQAHVRSAVSDHIQDALIIEFGPRDLLYWPAGYWHVGVSTNDNFHAALSLGIYHKGSAASILRKYFPLPAVVKPNSGLKALDTLDLNGLMLPESREGMISSIPNNFMRMWEDVKREINGQNKAELAFLSHALGSRTSAGFGPIAVSGEHALTADSIISIESAQSIEWVKLESGQLLVSMHGAIELFDANVEEMERLFDQLKRLEPLVINQILRLVPAERHPSLIRLFSSIQILEQGENKQADFCI